MIRLTAAQRELARAIIAEHAPGVTAWVFGSRLDREGHRYSDLDLFLEAEGSCRSGSSASLAEAFEESRLPFIVDLVDSARITPAMRARIEARRERL